MYKHPLHVVKPSSFGFHAVVSNFEKFVYWLIRGIGVAFAGSFVGALGGSFMKDKDGWLVGATAGFCLAGIIPAALAVWFLLLSMVGQVSSAARTPHRGKKKKKRRPRYED